MKNYLFVFFVSQSSLLLSAESSYSEIVSKTDSDFKIAMEQLENTRALIASEKPDLAREFSEKEMELLRLRRLVRISQQSQVDRSEQLKQLRAELHSLQQDASYTSSMLKEHALKITTLSAPGIPKLNVSDAILAASPADAAEALVSRAEILEASIKRIEQMIGGSKAEGKAIDPDGEMRKGHFLSFGPISYFINDDQSLGGDVKLSKQGEVPHFRSQFASEVSALMNGKEAYVALDPTLGDAYAMEEVDGGFLDLFRKGGLWIWPILLLAALSLIFGVMKLVAFSRLREPNDAWITTILATLRAGDRETASDLALSYNHPVSQVMHRLVSISENAADLVEETLYEQLMSVQAKATSMLAVIGITAATAPLLGLLGTVSGMISTFNLITLFGSGDPKPLAGGISEALITTLFGLIVAIPALILHAFLSRRANGIVQTTERLGLSFINGLRTK